MCDTDSGATLISNEIHRGRLEALHEFSDYGVENLTAYTYSNAIELLDGRKTEQRLSDAYVMYAISTRTKRVNCTVFKNKIIHSLKQIRGPQNQERRNYTSMDKI